jgi:hypothetical protein
MKTKKSLKFKIIVPAAVLLVLVGGGALVYSLILRPVSAEKATSTATFEFESAKAPGWFAGANIDGDITNAAAAPTSIKLASTTRIIAQGTADKPTGNCFVQYSYWSNNSKDPDEVVSELAAPNDPSTPGTFALQPTDTISLTIKTPSGDAPFQLHQYNVTGPDASQMSDGEEFGALKAGTGYIDIRGYCKTADELSVTLPVFSAVSFKE